MPLGAARGPPRGRHHGLTGGPRHGPVRHAGRLEQIAAAVAFRPTRNDRESALARLSPVASPRPRSRRASGESSGDQRAGDRPGSRTARKKTDTPTIGTTRAPCSLKPAGASPAAATPKHDFRSGASDLFPAAGCHAPDPRGHDRALLSGSEAPLLFGSDPGAVPGRKSGRFDAAPTAFFPLPTGRPGDP